MSWFKVDDGFHCHPKVLEAGNTAAGFYVRCGSWVSQQLTDGFVPRSIALLYGSAELADLLVEVKLWLPVEGGWQMHDFLTYNRSRVEVLADRAAAADRQKRARERAKAAREAKQQESDSHGDSHGVTAPVSHADVTPVVTVPPTRPDPTRPVKNNNTAASRGSRIPEDFAKTGITAELVAWARAECPLVDHRRETEKFVDYWLGIPGAKGVKVDWPRTWKNRMRDQQERAEQQRGRNVHPIRPGGRPAPGYDANGEPLRDPKTGVWMER